MKKELNSFRSFLFPGPKKVSNRKAWVIGFLLLLSVVGLVLHYLTLLGQHVGEIHAEEAWRRLYEEFSIHLFAGIFLFIVMDRTFHHVEKWYGRESNYDFDNEFFVEINESEKKTEIRILTTFLTLLSKKRGDQQKAQKLSVALANAINDKDVKVQILLLDPHSFAASQRKEEIDTEKQRRKNAKEQFDEIDFDVIEEIINTIKWFSVLKIESQKFEIRLYNRIPPFSLFQVGDKCNISFYPIKTTTTKSEHWESYKSGDFTQFIISKFEEIWNSTCALDEYLFISIEEIRNICFVDIYDKNSGRLPKNRVLLCYLKANQAEDSKLIEEKQELSVVYRGRNLKANLITQDEAKNQLLSDVEFDDNLIEYSKGLKNSKYDHYFWDGRFGESTKGKDKYIYHFLQIKV